MNKSLLILLLCLISFSAFAQNEFDASIYREINEQIIDTDNFFSKTSVQTNKSFETFNGAVTSEKIIYPDSLIVLSKFNKQNRLVLQEVFQYGTLKKTYKFDYKPDGKTILRERGLNNLDYTVVDSSKYSIKYYALKTRDMKQGLFYKYLDTLFVEETKYSYEYKKQSNSPFSQIETYKYKFELNNLGYLKKAQIFENDIKVGHFINSYDNLSQVVDQELFWDYEWFVEDTGFPSVRNQVRSIEYENGLIKKIVNKSYNATIREWEKTIQNYNCKIINQEKIKLVKCDCDDGEELVIKIDYKGNWISKSVNSNNQKETYIRELKYRE